MAIATHPSRGATTPHGRKGNVTMAAREIVLLATAAERRHGANADEQRDHLNNATIQIDTKLRNVLSVRRTAPKREGQTLEMPGQGL